MTDTKHAPTPRRANAPRHRTLTARLAALLALALIVACAQAPTPGPEPAVLRGTTIVPVPEGEDPMPLLATTLVLIDIDLTTLGAAERGGADDTARETLQASIAGLDVDAPTPLPSQVVAYQDGVYLAGMALLENDGSYELVLPDGDALPSSVMRSAEDALSFELYIRNADCSLVASDPNVLVTQTIGDSMPLPAPLFFTERGVAFGVTLSEEIDLDDEHDEITYVSVVYATGPTTYTTTGTECSSDDFTITVDASLVEGWNQMTWTESATGLAVGARSIDEPLHSIVYDRF